MADLDGYTETYTTAAGTRRRTRYVAINGRGHYYRIEEEFTDDGWRPVGREVVEDVRLSARDETPPAD